MHYYNISGKISPSYITVKSSINTVKCVQFQLAHLWHLWPWNRHLLSGPRYKLAAS